MTREAESHLPISSAAEAALASDAEALLAMAAEQQMVVRNLVFQGDRCSSSRSSLFMSCNHV